MATDPLCSNVSTAPASRPSDANHPACGRRALVDQVDDQRGGACDAKQRCDLQKVPRGSGSRRLLEGSRPRLAERWHGSWYYHRTVITLSGKRERVRRGGYVSRRDAENALDDVRAQSREECTAQVWTVGRWLQHL